jgi:hypothetical protein
MILDPQDPMPSARQLIQSKFMIGDSQVRTVGVRVWMTVPVTKTGRKSRWLIRLSQFHCIICLASDYDVALTV